MQLKNIVKLRRAMYLTAAVSMVGVVVLAGCGGGGEEDVDDPSSYVKAALIQNFIVDDPLNGDNGLPPSPGAPLKYGAINMGVDVDGNAIEAIDEQDLRYFEGKYYLFGQSFSCGSFNYAPGVNTGPVIPSNPNSYYRYCGFVTYSSDDLMNWKLVDRQFFQDPSTGEHYLVKKPRVVYSPKTKLYTLWFVNGQAGSVGNKFKITQSNSPTGPWGEVKVPTSVTDPTLASLGSDFTMNDGPDGTTWMITSHNGVTVYKLNDEKTGILEEYPVPLPVAGMTVTQAVSSGVAFNTLFGGIGLSYNNGWWYITGSTLCGNCIASKAFYVMAKDPAGPWLSPATLTADATVQPALISEDTGMAQPHGAVMLPDTNGKMHTLIPATHYRSSTTGAPLATTTQPGDNNLALSGLYLLPLSYDDQGRLLSLDIQPSYEFPLAKPVKAKVPSTYQAALSINSEQSVVQSWEVKAGEAISVVMPSVFQRTPDLSSTAVATAIVQQPLVNAPLLASLKLPDGTEYSWSVDARTVAWAPKKIPLNLPVKFTGAGRVTLTLSTAATNGGYGIAVGKKSDMLLNSTYSVMKNGVSSELADAEMLLQTAADPVGAPQIITQPKSISVSAGSNVGFAIEAIGEGLGYQWLRDGQIVLMPDGYNEWTSPAMRLANVTSADAGTYTVQVFNQVGSVTSIPVTLEVQ